ncbi:MAG: hypothetical protein J6A73_03585 [Lachnospiraceae bacterium]|nr:hypothetical protein [Lachnospiraceae bacterium]
MENNIMAISEALERETMAMQEKEKEKVAVKPRRVGTVSIGVSMVTFGIMFLLCSVFKVLAYETVFALWPVILIAYGTELLVFSFVKGKLIYDKGAVFIMILLMLFAVGMAGVDVCFKVADYFLTNKLIF